MEVQLKGCWYLNTCQGDPLTDRVIATFVTPSEVSLNESWNTSQNKNQLHDLKNINTESGTLCEIYPAANK